MFRLKELEAVSTSGSSKQIKPTTPKGSHIEHFQPQSDTDVDPAQLRQHLTVT